MQLTSMIQILLVAIPHRVSVLMISISVWQFAIPPYDLGKACGSGTVLSEGNQVD